MTAGFMTEIEEALAAFANFMWGPQLVVLLVGGGLFFMVHSRLQHFRYVGHSLDLLRGKYNSGDDGVAGDISHFRALATALAGTIGVGNISGVAVAITVGGPGAVFWMWVTALVGSSTKFYTASLAIMYRGKDDSGKLQGGPMYVIREGLGQKWLPLAWMFAIAGMIGTLPVFQINQLVQILRDVLAVPAGLATADDHFNFDLIMGLILSVALFSIAAGKVKRVSAVASKLVPGMVVFYFVITAYLLLVNAAEIPAMFSLIFRDAFTGAAAAGGTLGGVILIGVQRGVFSNEAGLGSAPIAHAAAETKGPVNQGLIAMLGTFIDTIIVCSITGLAIIASGAWTSGESGAALTSLAFETSLPGFGGYLIAISLSIFAFTTILGWSYYGEKCMEFLFGVKVMLPYRLVWIVAIYFGATADLGFVWLLADTLNAMMALPNLIALALLSPVVFKVTKEFFATGGKSEEPGYKAAE